MLKLIAIFGLLFISYSVEAAQTEKCVITSERYSGELGTMVTTLAHIHATPTGTVVYVVNSAKDCFKQAIKLAQHDTDLSGYGESFETLPPAPIPTGLTPPDDIKAQPLAKVGWIKVYEWNFHDGYITDSKGSVTGYTVRCLNNKMPSNFLGSQSYSSECGHFNPHL